EVVRCVEHERPPATHSRGEITPGGADHQYHAAGHVFAAMVACAFHHGRDATVANGESLAGAAAEKSPPTGCSVECDVPYQDVVLSDERRGLGREYNDSASGQPFADVVIRVSFQGQGHAPREERAEALAGRAVEFERDRAVGQTSVAVPSGQLT